MPEIRASSIRHDINVGLERKQLHPDIAARMQAILDEDPVQDYEELLCRALFPGKSSYTRNTSVEKPKEAP